MRDLDYLIKKSKSYDLVAEYVNENTLKVYSPKFVFDSWLIVEKENDFQLLHMSKKNNIKKCSYHIHAVVEKHNKIHLLQKIKAHNIYVAFHKRYNKVNLVDRVLNKDKQKRGA